MLRAPVSLTRMRWPLSSISKSETDIHEFHLLLSRSPGARHQPSPAGSRMLFFRFQGRGERTHGCENAPASEGHPRSKSLSAIEVWFKIHSPAPPRPVSRRVFQLDVTDDNLLDFEKVAVGCENRKAVLHGRGCDPEFIGAIGAPASHRAFRIAA